MDPTEVEAKGTRVNNMRNSDWIVNNPPLETYNHLIHYQNTQSVKPCPLFMGMGSNSVILKFVGTPEKTTTVEFITIGQNHGKHHAILWPKKVGRNNYSWSLQKARKRNNIRWTRYNEILLYASSWNSINNSIRAETLLSKASSGGEDLLVG